MRWFRMYADMPNDPKIGTLSDAAFRTWVELLCAACKEENEGDTGLTEETLNWALRRNVTETFQELLQKQLVTVDETNSIKITNWSKRQYTSDNSTDRVRKYREKKKKENETLQKRSSNALDTETETETDTEKKGKRKRFAPPTLEQVTTYCAERKNSVNPEKFINHYTANGWKVGRNAMKDWRAAVRTWEGNGQVKQFPEQETQGPRSRPLAN